MPQQHRLPWRQLLPAFISRQRLSTEDGDDIIRSGELGEINTQIIIRQRGATEGGTACDAMQASGAMGKQPASISEEGIEDPALRQGVGCFDKYVKQAHHILGVNITPFEFGQDPAESGFAVGVSLRRKARGRWKNVQQ